MRSICKMNNCSMVLYAAENVECQENNEFEMEWKECLCVK